MWDYRGRVADKVPRNRVGFVYCIENLDNGKKYIGKKLCITKRLSPPRKGSSRRTRKQVETQWQSYCGSNKELLQDIKNGAKIKKRILKWYESKAMMAYAELVEQVNRNALISEKYYNACIIVRLNRNTLVK